MFKLIDSQKLDTRQAASNEYGEVINIPIPTFVENGVLSRKRSRATETMTIYLR